MLFSAASFEITSIKSIFLGYFLLLKNDFVLTCSAGIGRTGTFIGLDALYRYGIKTETVDIFEFLKTMRKDRMNMIQTLVRFLLKR